MATVLRLLNILLLCALAVITRADRDGRQDARILLLLSSGLQPSAGQIIDTLRSGWNDSAYRTQLYVEYLDADLAGEPEYRAVYLHLLQIRETSGGRHFDLIITAGDPALRLIAEDERVFHGTPVVFLGIEDGGLIRRVRAAGGFTGVHESLPVYEFISLMRYLYPGFSKLHVIVDGLPGSRDRMEHLQQAADSLHETLNIHALAGQSWEQLGSSLAALQNEPLLLLSAREDVNGTRFDFRQAVAFITRRSASPVWTLWQPGIGDGLAGGIVTDAGSSARRAGDMARSILAGASADSLNVEWHGDYLSLADMRVLQPFGFQAGDLPAGMQLLNAVPGFWQRHQGLALLILSVAALVVAVALLLWFEIRRRQLSDEQLDERTGLMKNILDSNPDLMFFKDTEGRYVFCNQKFIDFFGKDPVGSTDYELVDQEMADFFRQKDSEAQARKTVNVNEEWVHGADGTVMLLETQKTPIYNKQGELLGVFGLSRDITALKQAQENLEHIAHHDILTGLPNRLLLNKKLEYALQLSRRSGDSLAVIFLDLDRFKDINDTIGHDIGDLLLKDVAHRLHNNVRDSDICARLGGDEFVVVLTQIESAEKIHEKCGQLLQVIARPYSLQGHLLSVYASAGISIYPEHGKTVDELIRNADAALHKAKELGRNRLFHYQRELTDSIHSRMSLEQDLRSALEGHEFVMHYQPQFLIGEEKPRRVEALLRWPHPVRGFISPHEFIPLAETSGMITELGYWIIKSACQQFLFWREQGLVLEKIAVNVSAVQINASFATTVAGILEHLAFDPRWLELEVTESLMMSGTTEVSQQIQQLRTLGVEFAIDDFGTGYSSLSKIKSMPVSVLKIDQSFVRDINDDINDYEIVRAIVLMARSLGLTVVAEGVEHEEQEQTLKRIGCEWVQGYYYARPMDGDALYRHYCG